MRLTVKDKKKKKHKTAKTRRQQDKVGTIQTAAAENRNSQKDKNKHKGVAANSGITKMKIIATKKRKGIGSRQQNKDKSSKGQQQATAKKVNFREN